MWLWASYLVSLTLTFFVCKVETVKINLLYMTILSLKKDDTITVLITVLIKVQQMLAGFSISRLKSDQYEKRVDYFPQMCMSEAGTLLAESYF